MLKSARILIVEDEPLIAMELAHVIEDADGIVAASARSVKEAQDHLTGTAFHAAVLDVRLLDGTVFHIAECLESKGVPFVFCTADTEDATQFSRWPSAPVLTKPYQSDMIIAALAGLLEKQGN